MHRVQPPDEAPQTGRAVPSGQAAQGQTPARGGGFGLEHCDTVLLRLGFAILIAVALAAGLLYWRLSEGPLSLGILTPQIEAALTPSDRSFAVRIADTTIALDSTGSTF